LGKGKGCGGSPDEIEGGSWEEICYRSTEGRSSEKVAKERRKEAVLEGREGGTLVQKRSRIQPPR